MAICGVSNHAIKLKLIGENVNLDLQDDKMLGLFILN
jgi:hypothetical protein